MSDGTAFCPPLKMMRIQAPHPLPQRNLPAEGVSVWALVDAHVCAIYIHISATHAHIHMHQLFTQVHCATFHRARSLTALAGLLEDCLAEDGVGQGGNNIDLQRQLQSLVQAGVPTVRGG